MVSAPIRQDKLNASGGLPVRAPPNRQLAKGFRRVYHSITMNAEKTRRFEIPKMSPEALVGIGITVAWLGIMCLLLGWAEQMRSVPKVALIWLVLGAVLVIAGGLVAAVPRINERRRIQTARSPQSDPPPGGPEREPEEQLY